MTDAAAHRALHVVREIALQHAHPSPLVIGRDVGGEAALVAPVNELVAIGRERHLAVPFVDPAVALETEEERATVVRAQHDRASGFRAEIANPAVGQSLPEMVGTNGEQPAAAQVREDQASAAVPVMRESEVEHVSAGAIRGDRLRKDDAVAATRGHVVHQDRPHGRVGHVDEDPAVRIVVRHDVLQSGRGAR